MRWKLSTLLVVVTLACILLARYRVVQNRYSGLQSKGASLSYDWENPSVSRTEIFFHQIVDSRPQQVAAVRRTISLAPDRRNWVNTALGWVVGDNVSAVSIDAKSTDAASIELLKSMPALKTVLLLNATTVSNPVDAELTKLLFDLECALKGVDVYVEMQSKE